MKFTTISTGITIILASLTSASPVEVETRELVARATSATITGYTISCTTSTCSYSATAQILPENVIVNFSGTSPGPTIPSSGSVFFTSSNPSASLTLSRPLSQYRLVLVYPLGGGSGNPPVTLHKIWPAGSSDYTSTSYVGSPSFTLTPP